MGEPQDRLTGFLSSVSAVPGDLARPEHSDKHDVASIRIPIRLNVQLLL